MAELTTDQEVESPTESNETERRPRPVELDPETAARRDAALSYVRKFGDPVLRTRAVEVDRFDERLATEISQMAKIMDDALGVGLAAPQVGIAHRAIVYRVEPDGPLIALINPKIESASDEKELGEEGCLSLPGVTVDVERSKSLKVSGQDPAGNPVTIAAEGLEARVIQHEIDHLDGVLIVDRCSPEERKQAMRALAGRPPVT